jgi:hypothetical protein
VVDDDKDLSKIHDLEPDEKPPENLRDFLNSIAYALDEILNGKGVVQNKSMRKNGFVLLTFPYGDDSGRCNYISNGAAREDIVRMFKTQIGIFEKQIEEEKGNGKG